MIDIKENVPLAPLTTFKIGGPARQYIRVSTKDELIDAVRTAQHNQWPIFLLSGGSNILISDQGFDGCVIHLANEMLNFDGATATVGGGYNLFSFIKDAAQRNLSGLEKMAGIPGTVGGAVRGNAGAFGTEISEFLVSILAYNIEQQSFTMMGPKDCSFSYRSSMFKSNPQWYVFEVVLELRPGLKEESEKIIAHTIAEREKRHIQDVQSAGSFFMNPIVENNEELLREFEDERGEKSRGGRVPAGWLIDKAGLRGKQIGGAKVSDMHTNYIMNAGDATAEDVIMLTSYIKQQVRDQFGVQLKEEVMLVGF